MQSQAGWISIMSEQNAAHAQLRIKQTHTNFKVGVKTAL